MGSHKRRVGLIVIVVLGIGCKGTGQQSSYDVIPETAPAPPAVPPPAPPPVDAAPDRVDAVADTVADRPANNSRKKSATPKPPKTGGAGLGTKQVTGNLSRAVADEILRGKAAAFGPCHSGGGEHGQVQIKLTMNDRGVVEIAKVVTSTLGGSDVELCMAHVAQRFKFPPPPGGGESTVTFQLKF